MPFNCPIQHKDRLFYINIFNLISYTTFCRMRKLSGKPVPSFQLKSSMEYLPKCKNVCKKLIGKQKNIFIFSSSYSHIYSFRRRRKQHSWRWRTRPDKSHFRSSPRFRNPSRRCRSSCTVRRQSTQSGRVQWLIR